MHVGVIRCSESFPFCCQVDHMGHDGSKEACISLHLRQYERNPSAEDGCQDDTEGGYSAGAVVICWWILLVDSAGRFSA